MSPAATTALAPTPPAVLPATRATQAPITAALVGNPNAGKSALFNALTGARQKIANYPGVTVERKAGVVALPSGATLALTDLPGCYSLAPTSPDEAITRRVIMGEVPGEAVPDVLVVVVDATNLEQHLVLACEVIALGQPVVVALNMIDLAARDGLELNADVLARALGVPVVPTVAVRGKGLAELGAAIAAAGLPSTMPAATASPPQTHGDHRRAARRIARAAILAESTQRRWHTRLDRVLLHPWVGPIILFALLFVMFQAVFAGARPFVDALQTGIDLLTELVRGALPAGLARDFLTQGVLAGVGAVVTFLPQILILFAFILTLEASGYMARAAFLMDRLMAGVGLSGRSFIPLLSSFACAVPGIMATRAIPDARDRLTTILVAPLMTCSARLPVYAVIIAAFVPARALGQAGLAAHIGVQGLVLFGLYILGIMGAMAVALLLRASVTKGPASGFIMALPRYQLPRPRDLAIALVQRALIFLRRAGTLIFGVTLVLWLLLNVPRAGPGENQVDVSLAGHIANGIAVVVRPVGFDRDIALALIPAMAAREVAVSALATTYAVAGGDAASGDKAATGHALARELKKRWPLPVALAFLAWYVFAPQCLSTIAVTARETNGWIWPAFMLLYMFALAYIAAFIAYHGAIALGW